MRIVTGIKKQRIRVDFDFEGDRGYVLDEHLQYIGALVNRLGGSVEVSLDELEAVKSVEYDFTLESRELGGKTTVNQPLLPPSGYKAVCVTDLNKLDRDGDVSYWAYSEVGKSDFDPIIIIPDALESNSEDEKDQITVALNSGDKSNFEYIGRKPVRQVNRTAVTDNQIYFINQQVKFFVNPGAQAVELNGIREALEPKEAQILKYILDNNEDGSLFAENILNDNWDFWSDKKVLQKVLSTLRKKLNKVGVRKNYFVADGDKYKIMAQGVLIEQPPEKPGFFKRWFK